MLLEMKKKLLLLMSFICMTINSYSQIVSFDAKTTEYGQLKTILGENWGEIDSLSISGPINAQDFRTMWECAFYGNLSVLNLENAQVEHNKIPDYALCDVNKQYWNVDQTIYLGIKK